MPQWPEEVQPMLSDQEARAPGNQKGMLETPISKSERNISHRSLFSPCVALFVQISPSRLLPNNKAEKQ